MFPSAPLKQKSLFGLWNLYYPTSPERANLVEVCCYFGWEGRLESPKKLMRKIGHDFRKYFNNKNRFCWKASFYDFKDKYLAFKLERHFNEKHRPDILMTNIGLHMDKRWHHCKSFMTVFKRFLNSFQFHLILVTMKQNMSPIIFARPLFMKWSFNMFSKSTALVQSIWCNADNVLVSR